MKRWITAENYSHMVKNVVITARLKTQQPNARAHTHSGKHHHLLRTLEFDAFASKHKHISGKSGKRNCRGLGRHEATV